jgi:hypothetical protein
MTRIARFGSAVVPTGSALNQMMLVWVILGTFFCAACTGTPSRVRDDAGGRSADAGVRDDAEVRRDASDGFDGGLMGDASLEGDEVCGNGFDDNLDGLIDEACSCTVGATQPCFPESPELVGRGSCRAGAQECMGVGEFGTWAECVGAVVPSADRCGDNRDQDCDGTVDESCPRCWPSGNPLCWVGACGRDYTECWAGGCPDPADGNCCSGRWRTTNTAPDGEHTDRGYNYCD